LIKNSLQLSSETWSKDIWGLIDYDTDELIPLELLINQNGFVYRYKDEIFFEESEINERGYEKLFEISTNDNGFFFKFNKIEYDHNENISSMNNAWFIFKPDRMNNKIYKYKINEGDIIKIGRITIRIKQIRFEDNKNEDCLNQLNKNEINIINNYNSINEIVHINYRNKKVMDNLKTEGSQTGIDNNFHLDDNRLSLKGSVSVTKSQSGFKNELKIYDNGIKIHDKASNSENKDLDEKYLKINKSDTKNKVCRICYMEEDLDDPINPLLQPCICSGSMKYIHYTCLKHWINNKCYVQIEKNDDCAIYMIKPVECELCKTKLPDFIRKKGILFPILELKPDFKNYLILESLTLDKNKNRFNYVVSLDQNKKICVGRGHESNVVFSDISVSRTHCIFTLEGKNVFIQDNDSTFGTLVLIQSPKIKLVENLPLYIQIGRTFFQNNIQVTKSFFMCCGISEKPNDNFYFKQNEKDIVYKRNYTVLTIDKSKILENDDDNNNNNNDFKNNEVGVINIKKINIKNKTNINGDDSCSKIEGQKESEKEEIIIEDKENSLNESKNKNKENMANGVEGNGKLFGDGNNKSSSIYIEDES